ncbi:phospholipase A and acyltransferase 2-like [Haliotis rubra]|uniref:phospholipase A and acyltransferase 2-like n=1 Tax=Haliotis rubra TaxID=36100 RepID=UPI001EE53738|nr:phospholipase A and acyltransferase 2-like [Haliotis rubra]
MTSFEVQQRNQAVLDNLQPGDLLEFDRGLINHWAVYIGSEEVVHFFGDCGGRDQNSQCKTCVTSTWKGLVRKDAFFDVVGNSKVNKNNSKDKQLKAFQQREIVDRALSEELREFKYNIVFQNCEHFATWCRYGKQESDQANRALTRLGVGALILSGAVLLGLLFASRK